MKKPLIAVDCDHVLADINEGVRCFVNETYGTAHTREEYNVIGPYKGYWERVWGVPEGQTSDRFMRFIESGGMERLPMMSNAIKTISVLKNRYCFVVVTARKHDREITATHDWLAQYANGIFDQVIFMDQWPQGDSDQAATKGSICRDIGAAYLIDDNYDHCNSAVQSQVTPLLFGDYGWNRAVDVPESMVRTKDWRSVEEYFSEH